MVQVVRLRPLNRRLHHGQRRPAPANSAAFTTATEAIRQACSGVGNGSRNISRHADQVNSTASASSGNITPKTPTTSLRPELTSPVLTVLAGGSAGGAVLLDAVSFEEVMQESPSEQSAYPTTTHWRTVNSACTNSPYSSSSGARILLAISIESPFADAKPRGPGQHKTNSTRVVSIT